MVFSVVGVPRGLVRFWAVRLEAGDDSPPRSPRLYPGRTQVGALGRRAITMLSGGG